MSFVEKQNLLAIPAWGIKEIRAYIGCGKNKAMDIRDRAIKEFDGAVPFSGSMATRDSVLRLFGSTCEREQAAARSSAGLYGVNIAAHEQKCPNEE